MAAPASSVYRASSVGCEPIPADPENDYYALAPSDPSGFAILEARRE
jgi:hypothetical protein